MTPVFKHLMVRAEIEKPPINWKRTEEWLSRFINHIGMREIHSPVAVYIDTPNNKGMTANAMIETSHIAMHVWDEPSPAIMHFDVFTCGKFNPRNVIEALDDEFEIRSYDYKYFDREHGFVEEEI